MRSDSSVPVWGAPRGFFALSQQSHSPLSCCYLLLWLVLSDSSDVAGLDSCSGLPSHAARHLLGSCLFRFAFCTVGCRPLLKRPQRVPDLFTLRYLVHLMVLGLARAKVAIAVLLSQLSTRRTYRQHQLTLRALPPVGFQIQTRQQDCTTYLQLHCRGKACACKSRNCCCTSWLAA